jgi:SET and MYND domain-containing protein
MLPTPTRALIQALLWGKIRDGLADLEGHVLEKRAEGDEWRDIEMMAVAGCAFSGLGRGDQDVRMAAEMLCKVCLASGLLLDIGRRWMLTDNV